MNDIIVYEIGETLFANRLTAVKSIRLTYSKVTDVKFDVSLDLLTVIVSGKDKDGKDFVETCNIRERIVYAQTEHL